jgi:hypothetical protein
MPYNEAQLRLFHGVESGSIPERKGLTRRKAKALLAEGGETPQQTMLKRKAKG